MRRTSAFMVMTTSRGDYEYVDGSYASDLSRPEARGEVRVRQAVCVATKRAGYLVLYDDAFTGVVSCL